MFLDTDALECEQNIVVVVDVVDVVVVVVAVVDTMMATHHADEN
jgi:hypothetical protein